MKYPCHVFADGKSDYDGQNRDQDILGNESSSGIQKDCFQAHAVGQKGPLKCADQFDDGETKEGQQDTGSQTGMTIFKRRLDSAEQCHERP